MRGLGVSEVGLRERAIKAYEEEKKRLEEYKRERAQNYAEWRVREFEEIFGVKPDKVQPVSPHECFIECDGLTFRVHEAAYGTTFEVEVQCPQCHNHFFREVNSLCGLGRALSNPAKCPKCSESSKPSEPREPSVEKQIVQKLREILDLLQEG